MNILFVFPGILEALTKRGGGREEVLLQVARKLSNSFNVTIIAPFFGKYKKVIRLSSNLMIEELYFPASKNYPWSKNKLSRIANPLSIFLFYQVMVVIKIIQLKKNALRIVVLSDMLSGIIVAIAAKLLNMKVVYYEGNLTPWIEPRISNENKVNFVKQVWWAFTIIIGRMICRIADAIIVNDELIKSGMIKYGLKNTKIHIVRGGVDTSFFKPIESRVFQQTEFTVGFIGRLTEEKGSPILLKLCKAALNKLPQVKFMIFGDGPYKKYFEPLPNVKYIGWVDHDTLPKWLSSVNAILSFQKTFGKGEMEALSCGKPIIAFKIGEMSILIKDKENGLLCTPCTDSLIEAISKLMNNEALLKKLSKNARREAITRYDWKIVGRLWKNIIEYVLKSEAGLA
jgi:glycosyltransferase involved in cell wall biosynthesis